MNLASIAQVLDLFAMSFAVGATAWFFFVQSPVLLSKMGREKFVPLQMRLTVVLFRALVIALGIVVGTSLLHSSLMSAVTISAGVGLLGALVNQWVVVPRALRAGGQTRKDIAGLDHEGSTTKFASEGAGSKTKLMHRLVVLFVVVMLGGLFTHGVALLGC